MKVMWVTMSAIGKMSQVLYGGKTQSGGWIDATYESLVPYIQSGDLDLHIVALDNKDYTVYDEERRITYHLVNLTRLRGKKPPKKETAVWQKLIARIAPDVIQVWGTEFTFGKSIEEASGNIPVCFYIQGVMSALSQHPAGDIPLKKLFKQTGILSALKFRAMLKEIKSNKKHVAFEKEMVKNADGIIVDNTWSKAQYADSTDKFYDVPLALNKLFFERAWSIDGCNRHTVFTVAGGASPIKGIHNLVLAAAKLKEKYPDIKIKIPGSVSSAKPHFLYDTIFIRHIKKLIKKYALQDNIEFLGRLSAEDMAEQIIKANVFAMPSCVETHSSSLREAMSMGCPVVSAVVGSTPEFVVHGQDGFLYRYDDIHSLAYFIDKLFADDELAIRLGKNGKASVDKRYPQGEVGEMLMNSYKQIVGAKKEG